MERSGDRPSGDSQPDVERVLDSRYAAMTPAEKLARVRGLTVTSTGLALAGLADRHPGEGRAQLLLRLARIRLGADVTGAAYGVVATGDGS